MPSCDVIIVGGGVNGLAAAGRLAKAGRKVVLLDAADHLGGGAETREFAPGYRVSGLAHLLNQLDPRVADEMKLGRHGLRLIAERVPTTALAPDGRHLVIGDDIAGDISAADRASWRALKAKLQRYADVLKPLKHMPPPRLARGNDDLLRLIGLGLGIRRLGRDDLRELMRMLLINVADVLNDDLADDRLKGALAFDAILGSHLGPRSPNSLILLLHRMSGGGNALPAGGMGSVAAALAGAARSHGAELRSGARAAAIVTGNDRAGGVVLDSGETLTAPVVLSAINPRTTFLKLVGTRHLDTDFVRRVSNIRMRGSAAKLHLALTAAPDFRSADLRSRLVIAPSVDAVENAFNAVKYGAFSASPVMEIVLPSAFEEGLAPRGHHVLSAIVHYAPSALKGGWAAGRAAFLDAILATLETHAPGIGSRIAGAELLTPEDIEARYGMVGGNWHHGELAVEQMLFLRPTPETAQYETPIAGLYLGGAGSHPGGGVSGAAGWNAAGRILAREKR